MGLGLGLFGGQWWSSWACEFVLFEFALCVFMFYRPPAPLSLACRSRGAYKLELFFIFFGVEYRTIVNKIAGLRWLTARTLRHFTANAVKSVSQPRTINEIKGRSVDPTLFLDGGKCTAFK